MARILIVDDNDEIRRLLRRLLENAAFEVIEAADGDAGLRCVEGQQVDLLITDIFMPGKDGLVTIRELRKSHPQLKIIAMSGGGQLGNMDILRMARIFGAFRVLAKPFDFKEMLQAVRDALAPAAPLPNPV